MFALDILTCPDCGGRLRQLATIEDREVIEKILTHLGLPVDPSWLVGSLPGFDACPAAPEVWPH